MLVTLIITILILLSLLFNSWEDSKPPSKKEIGIKDKDNRPKWDKTLSEEDNMMKDGLMDIQWDNLMNINKDNSIGQSLLYNMAGPGLNFIGLKSTWEYNLFWWAFCFLFQVYSDS